MNRRRFLVLMPVVFAAGCGFQLRRFDSVPFASLFIDALPGSPVANRVRAVLAADKKTRMVATAGEADAVLRLAREERAKTIISLSGAGRVTEYRLSLQLDYSVVARDGSPLAAPERIELNRDLTFVDAQVLAKGAEEALLYRDMDENAALRILRRLQSLKPGNGS